MNALFVANFPPDTGYAWSTIEAVWSAVAARLKQNGVRVYFGFPAAGDERSGAETVIDADFPATQRSLRATLQFARLLARHRIRLLYLTDQPTWTLRYLLFRLAGVKTIVIHDRWCTPTAGVPPTQGALRRAVKQLVHRVPGLAADVFIGVSDFITRRLTSLNGAPAARTFRVHNGIDLRRFERLEPGYLHAQLQLPADTPVIVFAGRLFEYKGARVLLEAGAILQRDGARVAIALCGHGPERANLEQLAAELQLRDTFFLGKRQDVPQLMAGASIVAVPSICAEAFGLAVVEGMAAGVPVVGARAGAIPELIDVGITGALVEPGDAADLARACARILDDPTLAARMGANGRNRAFGYFGLQRTAAELARIMLGTRSLHRHTAVEAHNAPEVIPAAPVRALRR